MPSAARRLSSLAAYARQFPAKTAVNLRRPAFLANALCEAAGVRPRLPDLIRIVLYATARCNARCLMCDVGQGSASGIDRTVRRQRRAFLEPALLRRVLDDPLLRGRRLTFCVMMTEPLLHPAIGALVRMIVARGHHAALTTNGLLLPEKAGELAAAGLQTIHVSLDGPEEIHDRIRGVPGAYRRAVEGIRALNRGGAVPVNVICTISAANQRHLVGFVEALEREGLAIDLLKLQLQSFYPARAEPGAGGEAAWTSSIYPQADPAGVDAAALSEALRGIRRRGCAAARQMAVVPELFDEPAITGYFQAPSIPLPGNRTCLLPWQQLALTTDGEAHVHLRCFDYRLGVFPDEDLAGLFSGARMLRFRRALRESGHCLPACTRCLCAMVQTRRPAAPDARS